MQIFWVEVQISNGIFFKYSETECKCSQMLIQFFLNQSYKLHWYDWFDGYLSNDIVQILLNHDYWISLVCLSCIVFMLENFSLQSKIKICSTKLKIPFSKFKNHIFQTIAHVEKLISIFELESLSPCRVEKSVSMSKSERLFSFPCR